MAPELVPISWFEILIASLVPALGAAIMFCLLSRFVPRLAVRVFVTVGLLFMLISLMGPLALPVPSATQIVLSLLQVVTGVTTIALLSRVIICYLLCTGKQGAPMGQKNSPRIAGIHHITAMAGDPQRNINFYTQVLGQRLVKTTVNFDDPGTYHFYYGDYVGTPGTILTFFPWTSARHGRPGTGEVAAYAYAVPTASLDFWEDRLDQFNVLSTPRQTRFGETFISARDPDGITVDLVEYTTTGQSNELPTQIWVGGPVPAEHSLRGIHCATLWVNRYADSAHLLTELFGYHFVGEEAGCYRYRANAAGPGVYLDLLQLPDMPRGQLGVGSIHHIAFRTPNDTEQLFWQSRLSNDGLRVTEVKDRHYFHSIYFREPNGVLFEIATNEPGFSTDEPVIALGESLKLPNWLEPTRAEIETELAPIERYTPRNEQ
jgi:glyoxalase family protein